MSEDTTELDSLLDMTLDDLDDLPSFKPFLPGAHKCLVSLNKKKIADHPAVELSLKMVETVELVDENVDDEAKDKEGDEASTAYFLDNEIGQGKFKAVASAFAEFAGTTQLSGIVEAVTEVECLVITAVRADKNDKTKLYLDVKEISVL